MDLKVLKNIIAFWFYNQLDDFKLYIFFKSLNKNLTLIDQKSFLLSDNFIKINSLLSFIMFFKYASTISIYFIKDLKSANIAKNILGNLQYIIRANILLKSIPGI